MHAGETPPEASQTMVYTALGTGLGEEYDWIASALFLVVWGTFQRRERPFGRHP
jgi:hypothetical protein